MKYAMLILYFFVFQNLFSQGILTIRQVFDFEPGDVFHYLEDRGNYFQGIETAEKKVNRITILNRRYSEDGDSVFYSRSIEGYSYYVTDSDRDNHYIYEYKFHSFNDSITYTNLDSSVYYYLYNVYPPYHDLGGYDFISDTLLSYSTEYCNHIVNEYRSFTWNSYDFEFGEGLGVTKDRIAAEECSCYLRNFTLVYYKKQSDSCGIADTYTGIGETINNPGISVWPNPVKDILTVEIQNQAGNAEIMIYNTNGLLVLKGNIQSTIGRLNVSSLQKGVYFISMLQNNLRTIKKFVKI